MYGVPRGSAPDIRVPVLRIASRHLFQPMPSRRRPALSLHSRVLLPRTRLAYVHLRNLLTDAKRDRAARDLRLRRHLAAGGVRHPLSAAAARW